MHSPQFGSYRILSEIGRGGMGVVYRAVDSRNNATVALKTFYISDVTEESLKARERFKREGQLLSVLDHPGIVRVVDTGEIQGHCYIAMEYLQGEDLKQYLRTRGSIEPRQALKWFRTLTEALVHIHAIGVIHRDIKPANIMLIDGELKLIDFGLIKLSALPKLSVTGTVMGTPAYMAPEQFAGKSDTQTPAIDQYSLALTIYVLLTGQSPFLRSSVQETAKAVLSSNEEFLTRGSDTVSGLDAVSGLSADFKAIILKCLRRNPEERYRSTQELYRALTTLYYGREKSEKYSGRQSPLALIILSILLIFCLACVVFLFLGKRGVEKKLDAARLFADQRKQEAELELAKIASKLSETKKKIKQSEDPATTLAKARKLRLKSFQSRVTLSIGQLNSQRLQGRSSPETDHLIRLTNEDLLSWWKESVESDYSESEVNELVLLSVKLMDQLYAPFAASANDSTRALQLADVALKKLRAWSEIPGRRRLLARVLFHKLRIAFIANATVNTSKDKDEFLKIAEGLVSNDNQRATSLLAQQLIRACYATGNDDTDLKALENMLNAEQSSNNYAVGATLIVLLLRKIDKEQDEVIGQKTVKYVATEWTAFRLLKKLATSKYVKIDYKWSSAFRFCRFKAYAINVNIQKTRNFSQFRNFISDVRRYKYCEIYCWYLGEFLLKHYSALTSKHIINSNVAYGLILQLFEVKFRPIYIQDDAGLVSFKAEIIELLIEHGEFHLLQSLVRDNGLSDALKKPNAMSTQLDILLARNLHDFRADSLPGFQAYVVHMLKSEKALAKFTWVAKLTAFIIQCWSIDRDKKLTTQSKIEQKEAVAEFDLNRKSYSKIGPLALLIRECVVFEQVTPQDVDREKRQLEYRELYKAAKTKSPQVAAYWYGRLMHSLDLSPNQSAK